MACLASGAAFAQGTISDGSANFIRGASAFDTSPEASLNGVTAAGSDELFEFGWWFRVSGGASETVFPAPTTQDYLSVPHQSTITWASLGGGAFSAVETAVVKETDGPPGPAQSGLVTVTLAVTNTSGAPLTVSIFNMADIDLSASAAGDVVTLLFRQNHLRLVDGANTGEYQGVGAQAFLVRPFGGTDVPGELSNGTVTNFDNSGLPFTGDMTAGFQWNLTIPTGQTRSVTARIGINSSLLRGDYNDDTKTDLLLRNTLYTRHVVWMMDGLTRTASFFVTPDVADTNKHAECTDDFSGDGRTDIVFRNVTTGDVEFWVMGGTNGTDQQSVAPLSGIAPLTTDWVIAGCGDVNRDGKADILWRNTVTQKLKVWLMNGSTWTADLIPNPDQAIQANWAVVGLIDYDGDGNSDMSWYNSTSGNNVQWFMDANYVRIQGLFTSPQNAGNNNWKVAASGDYQRGGRDTTPAVGPEGAPDLIFRNDDSGRFVGWIMDGAIAGVPTGNTRLQALFTCPTAVGATCNPADPVPAPGALSWFVVGPR